MHTCMHSHTHIRTHTHAHTHAYAYAHTHAHAHAHAHAHTHPSPPAPQADGLTLAAFADPGKALGWVLSTQADLLTQVGGCMGRGGVLSTPLAC